MHDLDEDIVEIIDAQIDYLSNDEDITSSEAKFKARQNIRKTSRFLSEEDELFDDPSMYWTQEN